MTEMSDEEVSRELAKAGIDMKPAFTRLHAMIDKHRLTDFVRSLKPGERCDIAIEEMSFPAYEHNGATFTQADQILENIVGSAYEYRYWLNDMHRTVTFERLAKPLSEPTAYVSPDRR